MLLKKAASIVLLGLGATGCTLVGGSGQVDSGPRPPPNRTRTEPPVENSGESTRPPASPEEGEDVAGAVVATAFDAIGSPYVWGGTNANGFDCSGLIQYAYGQYGIDLPRISRDQLRRGSPVEVRVGALEPGDLLGFSAVVGGEATHVGLYVGDGRFIHSSSSGVRVSNLREPYWQQHFMAARRIVR